MIKIGIIGIGLIGGSLAAALKETNKYKVFCYNRRVQNSILAKNLNYVDGSFDTIAELTKSSDVIIIATPLKTYKDIAGEISKTFTADKIISDVGSVKLKPSDELLNSLKAEFRSSFVPAHPIAGSEKTGVEAADSNLFKNKKLIITNFKNTNENKSETIKNIWQDAGSNVIFLSPKEHDAIYAKVSHLPQLLSFGYKRAFAKSPFLLDENNSEYKEFTRLTHSDENLWADIFEYNAMQILAALEQFKNATEANLNLANIPLILAKSLNDILTEEKKSFGGTGLKSFLIPLESNFKFQHQEKTFIIDFINSMIDEI